MERQWYSRPTWLLLLSPLSAAFAVTAAARRLLLQSTRQKLAVPVVVVGNISVGGTGKTPFIIALARHLQSAGLRPGIIARGYGVKLQHSLLLEPHHKAADVGDEPLLIARSTGCDMAVGPDRVESARLLTDQRGCNLILSDDGLQHYRLARDVEIAVIDSKRGLGNGWRLPVGPLREKAGRLAEVDWIIVHGDKTHSHYVAPKRVVPMHLQAVAWQNVKTGETRPLGALDIAGAVAIAGIGNPQRFFDSLAGLGSLAETRAFADHQAYQRADFAFAEGKTLLMTCKDAVKCQDFAQDNWWALSVEAVLPGSFLNYLKQQLISRCPHL